ncbi:hypothetical protein J1N35_001487 [Gossypium stocksii]|uniref:Uncharacterized protein n=1 Tax=Gossypium stocksii TaxID=47602 RepID=A0A9D3WK68_9ROSI|nr:hypothetical protein J1N35_001487 [Gossypium stocksii]
MGDVTEKLKVVKECTLELDSMEKQLKEVVLDSLSSNVEAMQRVLNSTANNLTMRDDALRAMVMASNEETKTTRKALNIRIDELEGELVVYRAIVDKWVIDATLNCELDVPKLKKFEGEKSKSGMDNFFWEIEQYSHVMGIKDNDTKVNTTARYFIDFALLWW